MSDEGRLLFLFTNAPFFSCSCENLQELEKDVNAIIELQSLARREGLCALEDAITERFSNKTAFSLFCKEGFLKILGAEDPDEVCKFLEDEILSGATHGLQGIGLVRFLLWGEGILHIQVGDNPNITRRILLAILEEAVSCC